MNKIDIRKIIIAPLYKKTYQHYNFIDGLEVIHEYSNEWIAIYPKK